MIVTQGNGDFDFLKRSLYRDKAISREQIQTRHIYHYYIDLDKIWKKSMECYPSLLPRAKMPGTPRITNMGLEIGTRDVGNHHSGLFDTLQLFLVLQRLIE